MGRAHEVRAASMAKTAAMKSKLYSRYGKEIYVAAKAGVPDPDMNLGLKKKIEQAKANNVPADVIKRAIEKAKGSNNESYISNRYEGYGPGSSTFIIDLLTDNVNRAISEVNICCNKSGSKLGKPGSVSYMYDNVGLLSFTYDDEDKMLETLIENDVEVVDIECEDGAMTVTVTPSDLYKAKDAIDSIIPDCKYDVLENTMLAQDTVQLDEDQMRKFNRLLELLDECDDVQNYYHNVEM